MSTDQLKLPSYGGQALIEGVMMRGAKNVAAAFRLPDGSISIQSETLGGIYQSKLAKIPFLRGLILLWDALGLGTRYLTLSANQQTGEDEKIEGVGFYITLAISLGLGVLLFFVLPAALGRLVQNWLGWSALAGNLIEGVIRLGAIVLYMWAIGKVADIARVFMYHGAEHKTINAFEAGAVLTPENVMTYSQEHPRCGTSFLLSLIVISILVFSLFGNLTFIWMLLSRIILIPVLAMIAYEYIRWVANHLDSPFVKAIVRPNLALQKLTTKKPDIEMIAVAIASFKEMLRLENKPELFNKAFPEEPITES